MRKWLLVTILLTVVSALPLQSQAQKIKVRRVKGNQAVVEFSGAPLQPGQAYELVQDEFSEGSSSASNRRYVVSLDFSLTSLKSDAPGSDSDTDMSLSGRFGWNFGQFEIGPLASYASNSTGNVTINVLKAGGWGDFNLIPNIPGEVFVFGVGGYGAFGQSDGGGASLSLMEFGVGPFAKWFPLGSDFGFRIDAGYMYQRQSGGTTGEVTITGFASTVGLLVYF